MILRISLYSLCYLLFLASFTVNAAVKLTAEELRVDKAQQAMPVISDYFDSTAFQNSWPNIKNFTKAKQRLTQLGDELWQHSKLQTQQSKLVDDRPLYWTRLALKGFIINYLLIPFYYEKTFRDRGSGFVVL